MTRNETVTLAEAERYAELMRGIETLLQRAYMGPANAKGRQAMWVMSVAEFESTKGGQ